MNMNMNMNAAINILNLARAINAALGRHRHPRNGKIARLPEPTRNLINVMLQDNTPYRAIIERLNHTADLPYPISEMNLSNWYRGGYQDWLLNQSKTAGGLPPQLDATAPFFRQLAALKAAAALRSASEFQAAAAPCPAPANERQLRPTATNCN